VPEVFVVHSAAALDRRLMLAFIETGAKLQIREEFA